MEKPSNNDIRKAKKFVKWRNNWNKLWKNTKLTEYGNIQARLGATLRVVFTKSKEIVDIFNKGNHKSHR